jgi:hypothetical protein
VIFLIQFIRFRRGVPEVIRTLNLAAEDASAALARVKPLVTGSWPYRTEGLRVMDDGGRTLIDWTVPVETAQLPRELPVRDLPRSYNEPSPGPTLVSEELSQERMTPLPGHHHHFDVGQPVSYAEDGTWDIWKGGYEIVRLCEVGTGEAQYAIRSADQAHDRIVQEHELQEDLGARTRGR